MALIFGDMRYNGNIRYLLTTDDSLNEYGELVAAPETWSDPTPCSIKTNSDTRKGVYEDGQFRQASFTVLVELASIAEVKRVRIERLGEDLGEYQVMSIEPLSLMNRTQIIV